jgi:hypothetical protein
MEDVMGKLIDIIALEESINRYRKVHPATAGVLSPPVSALATVYGWMVWHRLPEIDANALPEAVRAEYVRFYGNGFRDGEPQASCIGAEQGQCTVAPDVPPPAP